MEEKESTISGSMSDSGSESPSPVTSYAAAATVVGEATPARGFTITNMNMDGVSLMTPFSGSMTSGGVNTTSQGMTAAETATETAEAGGLSVVPHGSNGGDASGKKKRGRPRKYDSEGNLIIRSPSESSFSPASHTAAKKSRGKGFGSGKWNLLASLGEIFTRTAGEDFTPHILTVNTGEDLAERIMSFTQKGPRGICVLSAIGAVSNVTIRQSGSSILTYEGRFEILTLTGSFVITETGNMRNRTGGLSISLAGPDGRVIGGVVAGILSAASPIQVVIGSFLTFSPKPQKRKYERKSAIAMTPALPSVPSNANAAFTEPRPENEAASRGQQQTQTGGEAAATSAYHMGGWKGTETAGGIMISPDINVSAPNE